MKADVIIVGSGLAGISLAFRLIDKGLKVLVISDPGKKKSSEIAAGLINPIVFRRITFGWRTKKSLTEARTFYPDLENRLSSKFFEQSNLIRIHGSQDEIDFWQELMDEEPFNQFLGEPLATEDYPWLKAGFGISVLKGAAFVKSHEFIQAAENYFRQNNMLLEEAFDFNHLAISSHEVGYKKLKAEKLIFCDGASAAEFGFFKNLLFNPAKGEVLTIEAKGAPDMIFNGKVYGIPMGNGIFKIGSTYSWEFEDDLPSEAGKQEILEKLNGILNIPFRVINHEAGVRPTIKDRRPFLGFHPHKPAIGIFNGLGTKGYLLAPLLSKEMANHIVDGSDIPEEARITRFRRTVFT